MPETKRVRITLTPEKIRRLRRIKRQLRKTTPGEWRREDVEAATCVGYIGWCRKVIIGANDFTVGLSDTHAPTKTEDLGDGLVRTSLAGEFEPLSPCPDADFIASARDDVAFLLSLLD